MSNTDSSNTELNFNFGASETPSTSLNTQYSTVAQYLTDMQNIEDNLVSAKTAIDTKVMITKFRKLFYNGTGWNRILIPDTEDIPALNDSSATKAMVKNHQIALPDGETTDNQTQYLAYDAAHIFAILDASNHNGTLSPLSLLGTDLRAKLNKALEGIIPEVQDRLMASGWLGDLSEIVGEFYLQEASTFDAKQKLIDQFGAYYKNLANVDAMVMVDTYKSEISATDGKKLSAICVDYYGADGKSGEREKLKSSRYKTFADMIGLTWDKSGFTNSQAWITTQTANLRTCAAFYIAQTCLHMSTSEKEKIVSDLKAEIASALKDEKLSKTQNNVALLIKNEMEISDNGLEDDVLILLICFLVWIGKFDDILSLDKVLNAFTNGLTAAIKQTAA